MSTDVEIQPLLQELFRSQRYAVMATSEHEQAFTSLMAFAAAEDLRQIVVLTERATRKFANLKANSRVALLIDDRENKGSDTQDSVAVTAIGEAEEVDAETGALLLDLYLARHPYLADLARVMRRFGEADLAVLGICLGSQVLARAYGAENQLGTGHVACVFQAG